VDDSGNKTYTPFKIGENSAKAVRITFGKKEAGIPKTLTYYSCDISNSGIDKDKALATVLKNLPASNCFVKSASYLMHYETFTKIKETVLDKAIYLVQDDTGIPYSKIDKSKFKIELLYDRQFLIDKTIKTVLKNLLEGILLVVMVLCFALGTLKSGMIVASTIIFSVLILSSCMNLFGISANLMSLGAIDFGLLVDSSVVLVEYIICHLHFSKKDHHKIENIAQLSSEVFKPVFVGIFIIILVYVPILMFSGIEGKTFNQMALNVIIAMLSSIIVAFLLMPILCFYFINKSAHDENKFFTIFVNFYRKILKLSLNNPSKVIITCFIIKFFC
jgi:cobalt-zinc-cadmium resistance protein CzcA